MTKSDDKRVPALRFKGFTDEWEQRKLKNITKRISRKNLNLDSTLPLTISAQYGLVDQRKFFDKQIASKKLENYLLLKNGEFAYNKSYSKDYPFGAIKRLNNYKLGVLSTLYIAFKPVSINTDYLEEYFDSTKWYKEIYKRATEGARNHGLLNISPQDFFELNLSIPNNRIEQERISKILKLLSLLITLQQRKLTELQLLRTSLNQQLLKDNSSWKSVKLREILNIRNKQIFPNQQYPLMSFVQKQGVVPKSQRYNRDFLVKGNKKYKVTEKGDFIYSSNNLETGSIGINKTGNATISPVYSVFSSKNYKESLFIGLLSEKKSFIYKMIRFRQGVVYGQWKIPEKDFLNIKIKIPNYQEQEKIITLFTHIDNQFKQENKKLTDLQNFKQFLLQNMFI